MPKRAYGVFDGAHGPEGIGVDHSATGIPRTASRRHRLRRWRRGILVCVRPGTLIRHGDGLQRRLRRVRALRFGEPP